MKTFKILLTLLSIVTGLTITSSSALAQDYYQIKFEFFHSMRIPYHHVTVEIVKRRDEIMVEVKSTPLDSSAQWNYSKIDTSFGISLSAFAALHEAVNKINCTDIVSAIDFHGFDGTTCSIQFGSFQNNITYSVWSPEFNTQARKLGPFLDACKMILKAAGLDEKEIFAKKGKK